MYTKRHQRSLSSNANNVTSKPAVRIGWNNTSAKFTKTMIDHFNVSSACSNSQHRKVWINISALSTIRSSHTCVTFVLINRHIKSSWRGTLTPYITISDHTSVKHAGIKQLKNGIWQDISKQPMKKDIHSNAGCAHTKLLAKNKLQNIFVQLTKASNHFSVNFANTGKLKLHFSYRTIHRYKCLIIINL